MSAPRRKLKRVLPGIVVTTLVAQLLFAALLASDSFVAWLLPWGANRAGFAIEFDHVRHALGRDLVVDELRVRRVDANREEPPILSLEQLKLGYHLWPALFGRNIEVTVDLRTPNLALLYDDEGMLPWLPDSPASEPPSNAVGPLIPDVSVALKLERLSLTDGVLRVVHPPSGTDLRVNGVKLDASATTRDSSADAHIEFGEIVANGGAIGALDAIVSVRGSELRIEALSLSLAEGRIVLDGRFDDRSHATEMRLLLEAVDPSTILLSHLLEADLPGPISGKVQLSGRFDEPMDLALTLNSVFRERPLALELSAKADATRRVARELNLSLDWSDAKLTAEGECDFAAKTSDLRVFLKSPDLGFLAALTNEARFVGESLDAELLVSGNPETPIVKLQRLTVPRARTADLVFEALGATGQFDVDTGALAFEAHIDRVAAQEVELGMATVAATGDLEQLLLKIELGRNVRATGTYQTNDANVDLDLHVRELRLDPWLPLAGLQGFRGVLGELRGKLHGPIDDLTTLEADLRLVGLVLEGTGLTLQQENPMALTLAQGIGRAKGDLSLGDGGLSFDARADLRARTVVANTRGGFELAGFRDLAVNFVPDAVELAGRIDFDAKARGSLDDPDLELVGQLTGLALRRGVARTDDLLPPAAGAEESAQARTSDDALVATIPSLSFDVKGPAKRLSGDLQLVGGRVVVDGYPLRDISGRFALDGGRIALDRGLLWFEELEMEVTGQMTAEGLLSATLRTVDGHLEQLPAVASLGLAGPMSFQLDANGTLALPFAQAVLELPAITVNGQKVGALSLEAKADPTRVEVSGSLPGGGHVQASATLDAVPHFEAAVAMPDFDVSPWVDLVREQLPEAFRDTAGFVSLDLEAAGPIDDLRKIHGEVLLRAVDVTAVQTPIRLMQPTTLRFDRGRFELAPLQLDVAGSSVALEAAGTENDLHATVALDIDTATIDPFVAEAKLGEGRISGHLTFDRDAAGQRSTGTIEARISSLEVRGYNTPIDDLEMTLQMDGPIASVKSLRAQVGDGDVEAKGDFDINRRTASNATIAFNQVPYRIPKTLRTLASGNLRLDGNFEEELLIAGTVRIDEALYEKDVSLAGTVLMPFANPDAKQTAGGLEAPAPILERIRFDIDLEQGDDIIIRNNIARMAIGANLTLGGTAAVPRLQGEVNVQEGSIALFGRVFEIQRGAILFENPVRIDPRVNIEALTVIEREGQRTEVTLRLEGLTSQGIALRFSSIPSYDDADILFLLASGKTRAEALAGGRGAGSPTGKGAALSAVNLLASRYAKTTFGLDEFALEEEASGNVNVSVGKRIDERMGVRASSEFGSNAATTVAVEYRLTNNALVVATPNDDGSVTLVLQYRVPIR